MKRFCFVWHVCGFAHKDAGIVVQLLRYPVCKESDKPQSIQCDYSWPIWLNLNVCNLYGNRSHSIWDKVDYFVRKKHYWEMFLTSQSVFFRRERLSLSLLYDRVITKNRKGLLIKKNANGCKCTILNVRLHMYACMHFSIQY